jgi:hypothetical protein
MIGERRTEKEKGRFVDHRVNKSGNEAFKAKKKQEIK